MSLPWQEVEVPRGKYIGWSPRPPHDVTGKVLAYSVAGGTDANGNPCPQLSLELIEPTQTYRDKGFNRDDLASGELVIINAGQVALRRAIIAAGPSVGDMIKLSFDQLIPVPGGNEVKNFKVYIIRGGAGDREPRRPVPSAPSTTTSAGSINYMPPAASPAAGGPPVASAMPSAEPPF